MNTCSDVVVGHVELLFPTVKHSLCWEGICAKPIYSCFLEAVDIDQTMQLHPTQPLILFSRLLFQICLHLKLMKFQNLWCQVSGTIPLRVWPHKIYGSQGRGSLLKPACSICLLFHLTLTKLWKETEKRKLFSKTNIGGCATEINRLHTHHFISSFDRT